GFAQGLIGAGLIGTKRAATLEDENDLFVGTGHALPLPHVCGRREPNAPEALSVAQNASREITLSIRHGLLCRFCCRWSTLASILLCRRTPRGREDKDQSSFRKSR